MVRQPKLSVFKVSPLRKFWGDRKYQNRVFWVCLGLIFFIFPAMLAGGKVLFDVFVSPDGLNAMRDEATKNLIVGLVLEDMAWRVTIIGMVFCIGWAIVLISTHGYSDLEYIMVGISLVMVLAAVSIAVVMTNRCYDMKCEDFKFYAGVFCIISITILAYVISAGVGKRVGWFSLIYLPVLAYQTILWVPYLLSQSQHDRIMDGVVKAVGLLFTVLIMAVLLAIAGGWSGKET
jgi:hypothetical protein